MVYLGCKPWRVVSCYHSNPNSSISHSETLNWTSIHPPLALMPPVSSSVKERCSKLRLDQMIFKFAYNWDNLRLFSWRLAPHLYKAPSGAKLSTFPIKIHVHPSPASVLILWENNAVYFADPVTVLPHNILLLWNGRLSFPACLTEGPISPTICLQFPWGRLLTTT